jgi:probable LLM family oxidoreductase
MLQLGVDSFVSQVSDPETGRTVDPAERMQQLLETIVRADEVGLDNFGVGEHHRREFFDSAPPVILAAGAALTTNIRLHSAVSVLSALDPVRLFQEFATLDLISRGRAELVVGRGSFVEAFPLFGLDTADYDSLFEEKLDLLLAIRANTEVNWSGRHRPPLTGQGVYPRPLQDPLPIWIAVGGNPPSAVRAGKLGLGIAVAIIGGMPERFAPLVELYRQSALRSGHDPERVPVGINSHAFVAERSQDAVRAFYPGYAELMTRLGRERGWPAMTPEQFEAARTLRGALVVGSAAEVIEKILFQHEIFDHQRFLAQITVGTVEHAKVMRCIELFGTVIAPAVRAEVARRTPSAPAA